MLGEPRVGDFVTHNSPDVVNKVDRLPPSKGIRMQSPVEYVGGGVPVSVLTVDGYNYKFSICIRYRYTE